jgi:high-affinity iron transporter
VPLVCLVVAMGTGAGLAAARDTGPAHGGSLEVSTTSCGAPAERLAAGHLAFSVTDTSRVYATVYLTDPHGKDVFAEIPWITPDRSVPMTTALRAGRYAFRCVMSDGTVLTSHPMTVVGSTDDAVAGFRPMPDLAMTPSVTAYRAYLTKALPRLLADCRALDVDVAREDLTAARADWLTAHLDYERLGAAYTSFGDFDAAIDGMAGGLPQGVDTPGWTGFFSIEHALWHGAPHSRLRTLTRRLVADVAGLTQDFPSEDTDPGDLSLRAHEILENALQFQLTGTADYGSGTTLATLDADLDGTAEVLRVLDPLIRPRDPKLQAAVGQGLSRVRADVAVTRGPGGGWTPLRRLTTADRQRVDGDLGELLEQLSSIPDLLAPRTSA